jgi:hypothetical protein
MLEKGEIASVKGFFEDVLEVSAGLVRVDEQGKMEGLRHGDSIFLATMIASRASL